MSSSTKLPFALKILSQYGEKALKSHISNGKYYGPLVSRRRQANLRKTAIINGTYGKFEPFKGGWNPDWDRPRKMFVIKPAKGHIRERTRADRVMKIKKALEGMPDRLKKLRQDVKDRKPTKDLSYLIKKVGNMGAKGRSPGPKKRTIPKVSTPYSLNLHVTLRYLNYYNYLH